LAIANISSDVLGGKLADQGRVPESIPEEHDDWFVVNLQDVVSLVAKALDELLKWLSLLPDDTC
jgi:hypothetical protein